VQLDVREGQYDEPLAIRTPLGWGVMGAMSTGSVLSQGFHVNFVARNQSNDVFKTTETVNHHECNPMKDYVDKWGYLLLFIMLVFFGMFLAVDNCHKSVEDLSSPQGGTVDNCVERICVSHLTVFSVLSLLICTVVTCCKLPENCEMCQSVGCWSYSHSKLRCTNG
jgi:hypothetical protein